MRIVHVLDHSLPLHSGYTFRTAALLREQHALGWETHHLTSPKQGTAPDDPDPEQSAGLWFHRTPVPNGGARLPVLDELQLMQATERRLQALVEQVRPDIIHAHSPVLNAIPALRVGQRTGVPVAYEVRAFWEDAAVDHGTTREGSLRYRVSRATETWALKRADHVFTICNGLRQDIVARGVAADKVTVIPNAVDVENFSASGQPDPALQAELALKGAEVIGFVGSFYAYEGLDLLLEALPALLACRPDVRVLLVGGGPQEANLRAQAERLGVADKVVFTGRVPHDQVGRYYDLIDLLVYPRHSMRLTELVTPLKPLEAMAQQRVFMASDVGGHRELVRDGETGRLFRAGSVSALVQTAAELLSQRTQWSDLREAGRVFVEKERTWRHSAANYVRPYTAMCAGREARVA